MPKGKLSGSSVFGNLDAMASAQCACGKQDDGPQKLQYAAYRNAENTEGKQHKPDKRIQNKCHQRQRPAQYKQDAPQDESHRVPSTRCYAPGSKKVPHSWIVAVLSTAKKMRRLLLRAFSR